MKWMALAEPHIDLTEFSLGLAGTEFIDQLVQDKADLEALREARAVEEERAAGRRNRRDRRRAREQVGDEKEAGIFDRLHWCSGRRSVAGTG